MNAELIQGKDILALEVYPESNIYSAVIDALTDTPSVCSSDSPNWIQSVVRNATGSITITFPSGFFSEAHAIQASSYQEAPQGWIYVQDASKDGVIIGSSFHRQGAIYYVINDPFSITAHRQGSDYRQKMTVGEILSVQ